MKEATVMSENGFEHILKNTDILLEKHPNIIGSKTGYTDNAQGCLITVLRTKFPKKFIVNIVLGSKNRFEATEDLIRYYRQKLKVLD